MKKSRRSRRSHRKSGNPFGNSSSRTPKSRPAKTRVFEHLEERHMLTAAQIEYAPVSLSDIADQAFQQAADLSRYTQAQLDSAQSWVIRAQGNPSAAALQNQIGPQSGISLQQYAGSPSVFIVNPGANNAQAVINALGGASSVEYFYPNVPTGGVAKFIPNDPLFADQWHLLNTGQLVSQPDQFNTFSTWGEDIHAVEAWDIATGQGVVIGIVDDGLMIGHPDLGAFGTPNFDPNKVNPDIGFNYSSGSILPTPNTGFDFHGTAVAGLAAGNGNNGLGITGVAFDATLAGIRLISSPAKLTDSNEGLGLFLNPDDIDIYNNSWGPPDIRILSGPGPLATQALADAVLRGRTAADGVTPQGNVHVWAAGNGGAPGTWDSSNFDGYANSRYTIAVGAVNHNGITTVYNEGGANMHVVAPSGGGPSGLTTTDLVGDLGFNQAGINNDQIGRDFLTDTDYTSRFNGTSASAPIVSGVIALMIEAAAKNGIELSFRDIEAILIASARQNDEFDIGWQVNFDPVFLNPILAGGVPLEPRDVSLIVDDGNLLTTPGAGEGPGDPIPGVTPAPDIDTSYLSFGASGLQDNATGLNRPVPKFVNGAGFTTHDEQDYAYGHGVVDAALAVKLASSWQTKGTTVQQNARTTNRIVFPATSGDIPAAEQIGENGPWVPGSIGGESGFAAFFEEFANTDAAPFSDPDNLPENTRGDYFYFTGPRNMSIETVELEIDIDIDPGEIEHLRIALESPDGTQSDFNNHLNGVGNRTNFIPDDGGRLSWTFTSTRHYGEKGTQEFFNPLSGQVEQKPWRLIIDNYSRSASADLQSIKINFFGSEVGNGRVKGFVGLDVDGDGLVTTPDSPDYSPGQLDQVIAGARVWLDTNADGVRQSSERTMLTGADGNYFFDVPFGTWQVGVEIPQGYEAVTPGADPDILTFSVDVGLDADPLVPDDQISVNFDLLADPITFSGTVFADINGAGGPSLGGRRVYLDLNENGEFDDPDDPFELDPLDEVIAVTAADGSYTISESLTAGYYTVALADEAGFTFSTPTGGFYRLYAEPGDVLTGLDFGANPSEGAIIGSVFNDANGDGIRDPGEGDVSGFTVFLDTNGDGTLGLGEPRVESTAAGGFAFVDIPFGTYQIGILPVAGWEITTPTSIQFTTTAGSVVSGLEFGVNNLNTTDYGDLPLSYGIASHGIAPGYFLGAAVDGEPGTPGDPGAVGDDNTGVADDDGVVVGAISAGATTTLTVTASSNNLYFQGWIDFNDNGSFDFSEQLTLSNATTGAALGKQVLLSAGTNLLAFTAPDVVAANALAARFRYGIGGTVNLGKSSGAALIGEVEDYYLGATISATSVATIPGDYDGDGIVAQGDYALWKQTFGSTSDLRADGNEDFIVDAADFTIWRGNLGAVAPVGALIAAGAAEEEAPAAPALVMVAGGELTQYGLAAPLTSGGQMYAEAATVSPEAIDLAFDVSDEDEEESILDMLTAGDDETAHEALSLALEEAFLTAV